MPRKKKNARKSRHKKLKVKERPIIHLCKLIDDGMSPGKLVAAAEYKIIRKIG